MPSTDPKHTERARAALDAWRAAAGQTEPDEADVGDLLADLRHLCDATGHNYDEHDARAQEHYREESTAGGTLRAYTLSELRDRASISADHETGYREALANRCRFCEDATVPDADCVAGADADGHTYDAFGNALDGYEALADYTPDDRARLLAMQAASSPR